MEGRGGSYVLRHLLMTNMNCGLQFIEPLFDFLTDRHCTLK